MKKFIIIASLTTLLFIMSTKKALAKVTVNQKYRGCDPMGCGGFEASRTHGKHKGIDIVTKTGEMIFSPITGKVTRYPIPYAGDNRYSGIEIVNDKYLIKIFYVKPTVKIGLAVTAGQPIATAQDLALKFGSKMTNHAHVEVYDLKGNLIDPTNLF